MMRSTSFKLAAALSLGLCLLAAALWVRSYVCSDSIYHNGRWHGHIFTSLRGRLVIQWGWYAKEQKNAGDFGFSRETLSRRYTLAIEPMSHGWRLGGFDYFSWWTGWVNAAGQPARGEHVYILPWWFLTAVLAALPVRWFLTARRQSRRARLGRCPSCGYDLRETPDRCPECGTISGPDATAAAREPLKFATRLRSRAVR